MDVFPLPELLVLGKLAFQKSIGLNEGSSDIIGTRILALILTEGICAVFGVAGWITFQLDHQPLIKIPEAAIIGDSHPLRLVLSFFRILAIGELSME